MLSLNQKLWFHFPFNKQQTFLLPKCVCLSVFMCLSVSLCVVCVCVAVCGRLKVIQNTMSRRDYVFASQLCVYECVRVCVSVCIPVSVFTSISRGQPLALTMRV